MNNSNNFKKGSQDSFDNNWKNRRETKNNYWTRSSPKNQIELAFRMHWKLFNELMPKTSGKKVLEIGCGRGSISSYFADNDYDCTLLDISKSVIDVAKDIFYKTGHNAKFVVGDALNLPFENESFDVLVSIGLFEHFEDLDKLISEHNRVLKKGGIVLAYVVPEIKNNVQTKFNFINSILKFIYLLFYNNSKSQLKEKVFRSDYNSCYYKKIINKTNMKNVSSYGMYPLPMISHSPEFPFSLLPKVGEYFVTKLFKIILSIRQFVFKKNPWICNEEFGQAFLITYQK